MTTAIDIKASVKWTYPSSGELLVRFEPADIYLQGDQSAQITQETTVYITGSPYATPAAAVSDLFGNQSFGAAVVDALNEALDTSEYTLGNLVYMDKPVLDALAGKAASTHSHAISDVTSLQTALDAKQGRISEGTHIADADDGFTASSVQVLGVDLPTNASFEALVAAYNDLAGKFNTLLAQREAQGLAAAS